MREALPKDLRTLFEGVRDDSGQAGASGSSEGGSGEGGSGNLNQDRGAKGDSSALFGDRTTLTGTADPNRAADMMKDRDSARTPAAASAGASKRRRCGGWWRGWWVTRRRERLQATSDRL